MTKLRKRIREAFVACGRLCQSSRNASGWFEKAYESAVAGEKQHRRGTQRDGWKLPVSDTAMFFAVKWFLDTAVSKGSFAEACALRPDCLYAYGARDEIRPSRLAEWEALHNAFADIRELDYVKEIAP